MRRARSDPGGRGLQGLGRQCRGDRGRADRDRLRPERRRLRRLSPAPACSPASRRWPTLRALASLYLESVHLLVTAGLRHQRAWPTCAASRVSLDVEGSGTLVDARLILDALRPDAGGPAAGPRPARPLDRPDDRGRARRAVPGRGLSGGRGDRAGAGDRAPGWCRSSGQPVGALLREHRFLTVDRHPGRHLSPASRPARRPWAWRPCGWSRPRSTRSWSTQITRALWHPATPGEARRRPPQGRARSRSPTRCAASPIPLHPGAARFYREQGLAE